MADGFELDLSQVFRGIDFASERVRDAAARGMEKAMEELQWDSVHLAPILTGDLRSSAKVEVTVSGYRVSGEVSYSVIKTNKRGWSFNYALRLHEFPGQYANPSKSGTRPKFLSGPLKAKRAIYQQMIADEIRKELT